MKLSIITVNLNNRDGLQKTIDSVICQTFNDYEWIVIDGGSTDGSKELIEQYAEHFSYWVSEPDKGIYNAMNKGVRYANGEYIQFLNSGDYLWDKDVLKESFSFNPTADVVYADCNYVKKDSIVRTRHYPDILSLKDFLDHGMCHNGTFIKRKILLDNPYNENLYISSDIEIYLKAILYNYSYIHIPIILVGYDITGISSTNYLLGEKEARTIKETLISPGIQKDIDNLAYLNSIPKNKVLKEVDYYRNKYSFYHKLITASLLFMRTFEQLFHKSQEQ